MPVGQMGNYQEYLKRMPTPLREIESAPVRQHMFGNPFKIDKRMIIDEADIDLIGGQGKARKDAGNAGAMSPTQVPVSSINNISIRGLKRKAGPIPRDFVFTPYKFRRRSLYDDDSSSDGYFSSTPSSPNPYATPTSPLTDTPMYSYTEQVIQSNGRILTEEISPPLNNCLPESFTRLERLIESSTQSTPFSKSTSNGITSNFIVPTKPIQEETVLRTENITEPLLFTPEKSNPSNHDGHYQLQSRTISETISENGIAAPVNSHVNVSIEAPSQTTISNHKVSKAKKLAADSSKVEPTPPPPEKAEPPPVDDENTWQKNLTLRDELYLEVRRPILRKYTMDYFLTMLHCMMYLMCFFVFYICEFMLVLTMPIIAARCSFYFITGLELLLSRLTMMAGSYETRFKFVKSLVREALRFKRRRLAQVLEEQAQVLGALCKGSS